MIENHVRQPKFQQRYLFYLYKDYLYTTLYFYLVDIYPIYSYKNNLCVEQKNGHENQNQLLQPNLHVNLLEDYHSMHRVIHNYPYQVPYQNEQLVLGHEPLHLSALSR